MLLTFIIGNIGKIGSFLGLMLGFLVIKKNQTLKQENAEINKALEIQQKVIDAKEANKDTTADDVIKLMQQDKF